MNEYIIQANQVSDRKLEFTWTPNPFPGAPDKLWVEYPFDVAQIRGHDVFYPVLPLFLALGFADTHFHLVMPRLAQSGTNTGRSAFERVLGQWLNIVEKEAIGNFDKTIHVEADMEGHPVSRNVNASTQLETPDSGTALFLGGGAESLCALAELLDQKIKPHLISYLGPGWIGSDPATNESKVAQDLLVARELGLELHHVRSNIYGLFAQMQNDLWPRMVVDAFFVNRVPFTPMLVSMFAPLADVYKLGTVYHGHEKHFEPDLTFHCFTKSFTDRLAECFSPAPAYQRLLWNIGKVEVVEKLATRHPENPGVPVFLFQQPARTLVPELREVFPLLHTLPSLRCAFPLVGFDETRMLNNLPSLRHEIVDHAWSDVYSRTNYSEILEKTGQAARRSCMNSFRASSARASRSNERSKPGRYFARSCQTRSSA